jgi:hypothetical protein
MDQRKYKEARKRVRTKKEFYEHLTVFSVMSVFFFLLNALTAFGSWWFYWPILGWGIGVLFHYFEVFGFPGYTRYVKRMGRATDSRGNEKAGREE